jgi:hypothetical protein
MRKLAANLLLFITLTSCIREKPASSTSATDYWNKAPDLTKVTYEGGDGKSIETAVVIKNALNERDGIASEYAFIAKLHGEKLKDRKPMGQSIITKNGRKFDSIKIQDIAKDQTLTCYFDITDFYGKL